MITLFFSSRQLPLAIPDEGPITDLLWSDPCADVSEFGPNARGPTVTWGQSPAREFLKRNGLTRLIRGHQVAQGGFEFPFLPDESVVTMFTASNYSLEMHNRAAFLSISARMECDYQVLPETPNADPVVSRGRAKSALEKRPPIPVKVALEARKSTPALNVGDRTLHAAAKGRAIVRTRPRTNTTCLRREKLSRGVSL